MPSYLLPNNTCEHLNPQRWRIVAVFQHMFTATKQQYFEQFRNLIENEITKCHVGKTDKDGFATWVKEIIKHERSVDEQAELALECMRQLNNLLNFECNVQRSSYEVRKRFTLNLTALSDVIELLLEYIFYKPLENRWIYGHDYESLSYEDVLHNVCATFIRTDQICPGLFSLIKKLDIKNPFKWYCELEKKTKTI